MTQEELSTLVSLLEKYMEPHFKHLESKIDGLSTHMSEEHKENREKFQELFTSRNLMQTKLAELRTEMTTRIRMNTVVFSSAIAIIGVLMAALQLLRS